MSALQTQIGGTHYTKFAVQPAEFCHRNGLGYCESIAIRYITRHKSKNGRQDIEKAIHSLNLLLELEYQEPQPNQFTGATQTILAHIDDALQRAYFDGNESVKGVLTDLRAKILRGI